MVSVVLKTLLSTEITDNLKYCFPFTTSQFMLPDHLLDSIKCVNKESCAKLFEVFYAFKNIVLHEKQGKIQEPSQNQEA